MKNEQENENHQKNKGAKKQKDEPKHNKEQERNPPNTEGNEATHQDPQRGDRETPPKNQTSYENKAAKIENELEVLRNERKRVNEGEQVSSRSQATRPRRVSSSQAADAQEAARRAQRTNEKPKEAAKTRPREEGAATKAPLLPRHLV